jgi:hypothetical protein
MMEIFALLILAMLAMDASTPTRMSMTTTLAPKIIAIQQPESFIMMQSTVMTAILAQLTPVMS